MWNLNYEAKKKTTLPHLRSLNTRENKTYEDRNPGPGFGQALNSGAD